MADATLVLTFNAATGVFDLFSPRRRSDRPYAALRDDVATTAHYMGMDQPIPVPEEDVRALFNDCRVTILNEIEEAPSPRMAELGVPTILTTTYLIEMPPPS